MILTEKSWYILFSLNLFLNKWNFRSFSNTCALSFSFFAWKFENWIVWYRRWIIIYRSWSKPDWFRFTHIILCWRSRFCAVEINWFILRRTRRLFPFPYSLISKSNYGCTPIKSWIILLTMLFLPKFCVTVTGYINQHQERNFFFMQIRQ